MRSPAPIALLALLACPAPDDTGDTVDTADSVDTVDTVDTVDSGDTADTAEPPPYDGNLDFETWAAGPGDFTRYPDDATWSVTATTADPASGARAARVVLHESAGTRLLLADARVPVGAGQTVRFHAWVIDDDPNLHAKLVLQGHDALGTLVHTVQAEETSDDEAGWREYTLTFTNPASDPAATVSPRLSVIQEVSASIDDATLTTDAWAISEPVVLDVTDGEDDARLLPLLGTPGTTMDVSAGLDDDGVLYVSTNLADQGSDHLLFVWVGGPHATETVAMPWSKAGAVAGPAEGGRLVVLVQEEATKYCEWRMWDPDTTTWEKLGLNAGCNDETPGVRLEGGLHLPTLFDAASVGAVPIDLALAVAPIGTDDGGTLVADSQVPTGNGDGDLDAAETLTLRRPALLLGRLLPLDPSN